MEDLLRSLALTPAVVLSIVVGAFHTCLYLLLRGSLGLHLLLALVAAILGAYAGQALGARLGDPLRLGDYSLSWASGVAWTGIVTVALVSTLGGPGVRDTPDEERRQR